MYIFKFRIRFLFIKKKEVNERDFILGRKLSYYKLVCYIIYLLIIC